VTLYDHPGVHIFMNIDGRFFGTSDGGGGGNPHGGAGWLNDGAPDAFNPAYRRYHVLPSVLRTSTDAGHSVTFELSGFTSSFGGLQVGEKVNVAYTQTRAGTPAATTVDYPGSITTTGVVVAIAADGSSISVQASGSSLTLATGAVDPLISGLVVGDTVQLTYVKTATGIAPVSISVTAPPATPPVPAPTTVSSS
jgi:hypothetical protein